MTDNMLVAPGERERIRASLHTLDVLAEALVVNNDVDAQAVTDLVQSIVLPYRDEVLRVFGTWKQKAFELHQLACTDFNDAMRPIDRILTKASAVLEEHQARKKAALEADRMLVMSAAAELAAQNIQEQFAAGDVQGAELAFAALPQKLETLVPPAVVKPPKGATQGVKYTYELVDVSKLKPEYVVPDRKKINRTVVKEKLNAESVVGVGSIRVIESGKVSFRKARKKAEEGNA